MDDPNEIAADLAWRMFTGKPMPDELKPGGIERQEARGQQEFVNSSTLPKDCRPEDRAALEAAGVVFGEDADDLFVNVMLPAGWTKVPTKHAMWSDLRDDQGRKRACIFYKAASYDRRAHLDVSRRYYQTWHPCLHDGTLTDDYHSGYSAVLITDCDQPIHTVGIYPSDDFASQDELIKLARAWLAQHYPDHMNPQAYWEI